MFDTQKPPYLMVKSPIFDGLKSFFDGSRPILGGGMITITGAHHYTRSSNENMAKARGKTPLSALSSSKSCLTHASRWDFSTIQWGYHQHDQGTPTKICMGWYGYGFVDQNPMSTMVDISKPLMLIDMDVRPHMANEKHRFSLMPSSPRTEVKSMAPRAALVWAGLSVHSTDLQLMPQHTAKLSSCLHGQLRAWLQLACRHLLPRLRSCNKFQGITKHGKKGCWHRSKLHRDANHLRQDSQLQWGALRSSCWYCS